jgi:ATP-dependent DNA helicase DinG
LRRELKEPIRDLMNDQPEQNATLPADAAHELPSVMVLDGISALVIDEAGKQAKTAPAAALKLLSVRPFLICHAGYLVSRLALAAQVPQSVVRTAREQAHMDVCELFAFTTPAAMVVPTPPGLSAALGLDASSSNADMVRQIADTLLARLADDRYPHQREAFQVANFLDRGKWPWAKLAMARLDKGGKRDASSVFATGLNVWDRLDEWEDDGPRPPGSHEPVTPEESQKFLASVLGGLSEARPQQVDYAGVATAAFKPRETPSSNSIVLAEAGTGLGKTLGYLAPSYLWASRNNQAVWISTYTKNLQRQLEQEAARLVPDPAERRHRIVVRKGRENYVCLLNMQEAFARMTASNPRSALMAGLIARWVRYSKDGDMVGGDFPAWLMGLFYDANTGDRTMTPMGLGLTDRRGECIYSACTHYRKCFIEKAVRAGRKADLVIANHALVLHQIAVDHALGEAQVDEDQERAGGLKRLVFDEGHHLFDAADSAFSGHLTGLETTELRRWIRGPETQRRRGRGLVDRLGDLAGDDDEAETLLSDVLAGALCLPGPGWMRRVQAGQPEGETESFLALVRQQVIARADERQVGNLETDCRPFIDGLQAAAGTLAAAMIDLKRPMAGLARRLMKRLDDEAAELASAERARIEALARSLTRRSQLMLGGFIEMLSALVDEPRPEFCEWFSVEQAWDREVDTGLHSHWIDPTVPLASAVLQPADGVIITSATLRDRPPEMPDDWRNAEMRTGSVHLPYPVIRHSWDSPFDYLKNSRLIVVNDMGRENMDHLAAAYRELFLASGGGALGLFTAISRLRAVHRRLVQPMAEAGLPLYAQHADPIDTGTLVDMFRSENNACLLGTDAVRDGVDVPGDSLRLIVMDRVPWGQPTILEKARRGAFGGQAWQDMQVRLRLRQAFGRLIRSASDRGCFVMLDARMASRFSTAFPPGLAIERVGLVDAIEIVRNFRNEQK